MSDAFELEICQGKYRYRYEAGKQEVWRNGEPWEVMNGRLIGDKFVFSLAVELDEALKERDALRAEVIHIKEVEFPRKAQAVADGWRGKCERLEAKVAEMEQQEPVEWQARTRPTWNDGTWGQWSKCSEGHAQDIKKTPLLHDWLYEARALYALPGAQPAPGAPWVSLAERMPNPDKHDRVLIYTEGYDFGGEQVFDVKAEALNECRYIDPDEQPETCKAASHWMPHPRNVIFDYAARYAQPAPSVPDVDALAQFIREIDGAHQLGAGVLAERIVEWLAAPEAKP